MLPDLKNFVVKPLLCFWLDQVSTISKYQGEGDYDFGLTEDAQKRLDAGEARGRCTHNHSYYRMRIPLLLSYFLLLASVLPSLQFYTVTQ